MNRLKPGWFLLVWLVVLVACSNSNQKQFPHQQFPEKRIFSIEVNSVDAARDFYSWTEDRIPLVSAHRGGPYPGFPENALETFQNVVQSTPAIIEFDVAITKDTVLVLMHDNTLDRTTTGSGKVIDFTYDQLQELFLVDNEGTITEFRIPTFTEALQWAKGKALLTVDMKREVPFEMVVAQIQSENAGPYAAVITYSLEAAQKIHRLDPDLMLSVSMRNEEELERFEASGIPVENTIAFTGTSERTPAFNQLLHEKGVFTILGVLGNLDKSAVARGDQLYHGFVESGADILATDRPVEAAAAIESLVPAESSKSKYFK